MKWASALVLALAQGGAAPEWKTIEPGLALVYPRDHGAHPAYKSEWWYVTGEVHAADGARLGFQLTIFRSGLDASAPAPGDSPLRARQVLAGHLVVTDVARATTRFAERLRRVAPPLASFALDDLDLVLEDWSMRRTPDDRLELAAADPVSGIGLALELAPRTPLVLHGEHGVSSKGGPGNASAYVSWPRMSVRGRLTAEGKPREVEGEAWFDHEFGSSFLGDDVRGWDWFGLRLDDGRALMAFELRGARPGAGTKAGTWVAADGTSLPIAPGDLRIEALARWTSPRSGAEYPARWRLLVGSEELELVPLVPDCELDTRSTGVVYWEGPVEVRGALTGRGYAELTGYAGSLARRF